MTMTICFDHGLTSEAFAAAQKLNRLQSMISMQPLTYNPAYLPAPEMTAVELKYDGIDMTWRGGMALTRSGIDMDCAKHILPALRDLEGRFGMPMAFHGQYMHQDGRDAAGRCFQARTAQGFFVIFDAVSMAAYTGREFSPPLITRRALLCEAMELLHDDGTVQLGKHATGFDQEGVEMAAGEAWAQNLEGIVIKDLASPYVRGNSPFWLKIRKDETLDLEIVGTAKGAGEWLHALLCLDPVSNDVVQVYPGFSDTQRAKFWADRHTLTGRIAEIKTTGRSASGRICSPSFLRLRDDKELTR